MEWVIHNCGPLSSVQLAVVEVDPFVCAPNDIKADSMTPNSVDILHLVGWQEIPFLA